MSWMRASSGFHRVGQALGDVVTVDSGGNVIIADGSQIRFAGVSATPHLCRESGPTTGLTFLGAGPAIYVAAASKAAFTSAGVAMGSGADILLDGDGMLAHVDNPTTGILLDGNIVSLQRSGFEGLGIHSGEARVASGSALTLKGKLVTTPSAPQAITAAGDSLTVNAAMIEATSTGAHTLTSTPTLSAGVDGQIVTVTLSGANSITLQDEASLPGSGLQMVGGGAMFLNSQDSGTFRYDAALGFWCEQLTANV